MFYKHLLVYFILLLFEKTAVNFKELEIGCIK